MSNPEKLTKLMREVWELAEAHEAAEDFRAAYLLTVAGNLIEGTFTTDPLEKTVKHAVDNADEIYHQDVLKDVNRWTA